MSENDPSIGTPIYDELRQPDELDGQPAESPSSEGEHVVITAQTAGSAGAAHTEGS